MLDNIPKNLSIFFLTLTALSTPLLANQECNTECPPCIDTLSTSKWADAVNLNPCYLKGVWFPEAPPLFTPFMADPRALVAALSLRLGDNAIDEYVADVSYADLVPFYRWFNVWGGDLDFELDGALWAIFEPFHYSAPLVNADYYIGVALSWKRGWLSFRTRFYHISSHIGDEFLINNPGFDRRNPSAEYLDFFASYLVCGMVRVYGGIGIIPFSDESYAFKKLYFEGGAESYLPFLHRYSPCNMLLARPFLGMDFLWSESVNYRVDSTYVLGYEWAKLCGQHRKLRVYLQYRDGFCLDGQFSHLPTDYFSIRLTYGY